MEQTSVRKNTVTKTHNADGIRYSDMKPCVAPAPVVDSFDWNTPLPKQLPSHPSIDSRVKDPFKDLEYTVASLKDLPDLIDNANYNVREARMRLNQAKHHLTQLKNEQKFMKRHYTVIIKRIRRIATRICKRDNAYDVAAFKKTINHELPIQIEHFMERLIKTKTNI